MAERLNNNTNTNNEQEQFPQSQEQLASQQQSFNGLMKFAVQPSAVKATTNMSTVMGPMGSM